MAYRIENLAGHLLCERVVDGPLPQFGDDIIVEYDGGPSTYRVLGVLHRLSAPHQGEAQASATVLVDDERKGDLGEAIARARRARS